MEKALSNGVCGGCLTMRIKNKGFVFRLFEFLVNFRARYFKVLDGDLGQFVRKDIFFKIGAYDHVPVMEDILFGRKLRKEGEVIILPDAIEVSVRKWRDEGFAKTFYRYEGAYMQLWLGKIRSQKEEID